MTSVEEFSSRAFKRDLIFLESVHFFEIMMLQCPPFFVHFLVFRYHPLLCTFYQKASKYDHIILDFCPYKHELINLF